MLNARLTDEEMLDTELVRAKVKDLAKLGEMKWRYRVVEEGESPRDQAIEILTQASRHRRYRRYRRYRPSRF